MREASVTYQDGNAAAGPLAVFFRTEVTTARVTCAGCGAAGALAGLRRYGAAMGIVLRCAACDAVVLRLVEARGELWLDPRGLACLRPEAPR